MRENFQQKKPTQHSKKERERGERGRKKKTRAKKTSETNLMKKMIEETFL
jgi:hypothetical protein